MKKVYSKPEIMFEDFTLSVDIAGGCEIIIDAPSNGTCGYKYEGGGGDTMFIQGVTGCNLQVDDDENNGFCYHVPIESHNLFNS